MAHLYEPLHPAILRTLRGVVRAAKMHRVAAHLLRLPTVADIERHLADALATTLHGRTTGQART